MEINLIVCESRPPQYIYWALQNKQSPVNILKKNNNNNNNVSSSPSMITQTFQSPHIPFKFLHSPQCIPYKGLALILHLNRGRDSLGLRVVAHVVCVCVCVFICVSMCRW